MQCCFDGWCAALQHREFSALSRASAMSRWRAGVAPVRGGTYFLCRRKESKQRKRLNTANSSFCPRTLNVPCCNCYVSGSGRWWPVVVGQGDWCERLSFAYFSLPRHRKVGAAPHRGNACAPARQRGCQRKRRTVTPEGHGKDRADQRRHVHGGNRSVFDQRQRRSGDADNAFDMGRFSSTAGLLAGDSEGKGNHFYIVSMLIV
jgi:hypothetical protein